MVGEPLCPVGLACRDYLVIVMGVSGRVFGGYDECLVLLGDTPEEAIDNLCNGRRPPRPGYLEDCESDVGD